MKRIALFLIVFVIFVMIVKSFDTNPYSEGTHYRYYITCENGVVIQNWTTKNAHVRYRRDTIKNSDGTLLRCGEKIY
jgi:hypothetical protein